MMVLESMIPKAFWGHFPTNDHIILPGAVTEGSEQYAHWRRPFQNPKPGKKIFSLVWGINGEHP